MTLVMMWAVLIVSLGSLLFLDGSTLRRFLPAALFITVINTIIAQLGPYFGWWKTNATLFAWSGVIDVPLVYGLFFAGTIWVMHWTYGRLVWYLLLNAALNGFFAYVAAPVQNRLGNVYKGTLPESGLFGLMFGSALVLYLFQLWYEREEEEIRIGEGMGRYGQKIR